MNTTDQIPAFSKCPVISDFLRRWNDALPDDQRDALLRPLTLRLIGTHGSAQLEERRAMMAFDWLVRTYTPTWLDLAGLTAQAVLLRQLPEITDITKIPSLMPVLTAVKSDVSAARSAAEDAAADAAGDAARYAAEDAALDATLAAAQAAALDAALDAAWYAARDDAAWYAARSAALAVALDAVLNAALVATGTTELAATRADFAPTVKLLQQSALGLVNRMIDAKEETT